MPAAVQVIVHEGGPAFSSVPPELLRATVIAADGPILTVRLREAPKDLTTIGKGDTVRCLKRPELRHPLLVTEQYLDERRHSYVTACEECGFPEAFDPPRALAAKAFPDEPITTGTFTTECPLCEGTQMVRLLPPEPTTTRDADVDEIRTVVADVVARQFGEQPAEVMAAEQIGAFGGDDLDAIAIAFGLEAHFVVCLPDESLEDLLALSVEKLTARLQATLAEHRPGQLLDLDA